MAYGAQGPNVPLRNVNNAATTGVDTQNTAKLEDDLLKRLTVPVAQGNLLSKVAGTPIMQERLADALNGADRLTKQTAPQASEKSSAPKGAGGNGPAKKKKKKKKKGGFGGLGKIAKAPLKVATGAVNVAKGIASGAMKLGSSALGMFGGGKSAAATPTQGAGGAPKGAGSDAKATGEKTYDVGGHKMTANDLLHANERNDPKKVADMEAKLAGTEKRKMFGWS